MGIDGVWNDMNEPAVFDNTAKQMPMDNWHRADAALGGAGPHSRYHNVYGYLMVKASREGIAAARPEKRPFILTRSNFLGGQRFAATWTGDNRSNWEHLHWSITMALNLGLSGQPFAGPDIGGFAGDADAKLFARWMGIGTLLPFARAHSIKDSTDHEPWSFGEACEATCRRAITRRYRLLPYLYTLFRDSHLRGMPVARPLFFLDPRDPALREVDDSFLIGSDVLVRASVREDGSRQSPEPASGWRAWDPTPMDDGSHDPDLPELWFRGGSIVPLGPAMQFSDEKPLNPLTLIVTPDAAGSADGWLYEDAGDGYGYQQGQYRLTHFTCRREGESLVIRRAEDEGTMPRIPRQMEVVALLPSGLVRSDAASDGDEVRIRMR
jgi:alpha-glucosidase